MKKIYTKKQIAEAIAYWKNIAKMNESKKKSNESEEDQEKAEKKEKKTEDTPKKETKKEKKPAEDKPKKAKKKPESPAEEPETEEAPEDGSDDLDLGDDFGIPDGEEEETTGDTEETPAEDDVVTMEGPTEEDFTEDTPDDVEEPAETTEETVKEPEISEAEFFGYKNEVSEAAPGSARYEPNTVGAVMELLKKSDPNDRLFIKLTPGSIELIPIDIYRSIRMNGGITYMEVAKGKIKLRE